MSAKFIDWLWEMQQLRCIKKNYRSSTSTIDLITPVVQDVTSVQGDTGSPGPGLG